MTLNDLEGPRSLIQNNLKNDMEGLRSFSQNDLGNVYVK